MKHSHLFFIFILILGIISPSDSQAEELSLLRRWVVFPFDSDPELRGAAESSWWKCREKITETKKYLVASKQLLIQKDVFQSRRELQPNDIKLLAQLLEADVILTGYQEGRKFTLNMYLAKNQQLFYTRTLQLHPGLKTSDQMEIVSEKMTQELMSTIPYQAFTITDPLIGKTIYDEEGKWQAIVDVGVTDGLVVGSDIQWVKVILPDTTDSDSSNTPLLSQSKIQIIGEGKITRIRKGVVVAEILRAQNINLIKEQGLVRIPKEADKVKKAYLSNLQGTENKPQPEAKIETLDIAPVTISTEDSKRTSLIFGSILSVLGILALAF